MQGVFVTGLGGDRPAHLPPPSLRVRVRECRQELTHSLQKQKGADIPAPQSWARGPRLDEKDSPPQGSRNLKWLHHVEGELDSVPHSRVEAAAAVVGADLAREAPGV